MARDEVKVDTPLLRFLTCGSVDDGKSTLIGRLLYDSKLLHDDQLSALERDSRRYGTTGEALDFALLVDGLEMEREQGITIDVAYRFFATERRSFIVADAPGHEQYTRNMATGASTADLALLLIDARKGILQQTRRHALICSLFGIRQIILAVNKMDLVGWAENVFEQIVADFRAFSADLDFARVTAIPLSARRGDNVASGSGEMPWYRGPSLMAALEAAEVGADAGNAAFRFPIQWVNRPNADFRGFSGTLAAGTVRVGDTVAVSGTAVTSRIARIVTMNGDLQSATTGDAVTLTLADEVDAARGDVLATPEHQPAVVDQFTARLIWVSDDAMLPGRPYLLRIGTRTVPATITAIKHRIDVNTHEKLAAKSLNTNEVALCNLATTMPVALDPYAESRTTGGFILIDRHTNQTAAAGMIEHALRRATNVQPQPLLVGQAARAGLKGQKAAIVWFTGLSGAGKSTIANLIEQQLLGQGRHTMLLDGDNMRRGLSRDLGFTDADRVENIRRAGEVARLMVEAGMIVICSFISPFAAERQLVRSLVEAGEFLEIFVDTPLETCMARDPKGLYAKARAGQIRNFTGLGSVYEPPEAAELVLQTESDTAEALATKVVELLRARGIIGAENA